MGFHKLANFDGLANAVQYWEPTNSLTECLAICFSHGDSLALVLGNQCTCGTGGFTLPVYKIVNNMTSKALTDKGDSLSVGLEDYNDLNTQQW